MATKTPTTVEDWSKILIAATKRLENANTESAITKAAASRDEAMIGMRDARASYAQIAQVLGGSP